MQVPRNAHARLASLARVFPAVTVTGPRQAGKTTLCKKAFPDHRYVSLERPDQFEQARLDPLGLLRQGTEGMILDEVQRAPDLLSWIQVLVDEDPRPGRFILTSSQNLALRRGIDQSLAGRTALLQLLPLSHDELCRFTNAPQGLWSTIWSGSFPAIFERDMDPADWHAAYAGTVLERDLRDLIEVRNLQAFRSFLHLAAVRTGQLLNINSLAGDAGIAHGTARAWLSVLETAFTLVRLPAWQRNLSKRLVKAPKLHMLDTGLACYLLGIRSPDQLEMHPLRGPLFETWVTTELLKRRLNAGLPPDLHHFRDRKGQEVDLILEDAGTLLAIEAKSGATVHAEMLRPIERFLDLASSQTAAKRQGWLVYGGDEPRTQSGLDVVPWRELATKAIG